MHKRQKYKKNFTFSDASWLPFVVANQIYRNLLQHKKYLFYKQISSNNETLPPAYLHKVNREDAPFSSQLAVQPSLLAGLGDIFEHISRLHCELVRRRALEVQQHQHLCRASTNGAEN